MLDDRAVSRKRQRAARVDHARASELDHHSLAPRRTLAMRRTTSALAAASAQYFEGLEALFRKDPEALDPGWRAVFQLLDEVSPMPRAEDAGKPASARDEAALAAAYRRHGHRFADIDPLRLMDAASRMERR